MIRAFIERDYAHFHACRSHAPPPPAFGAPRVDALPRLGRSARGGAYQRPGFDDEPHMLASRAMRPAPFMPSTYYHLHATLARVAGAQALLSRRQALAERLGHRTLLICHDAADFHFAARLVKRHDFASARMPPRQATMIRHHHHVAGRARRAKSRARLRLAIMRMFTSMPYHSHACARAAGAEHYQQGQAPSRVDESGPDMGAG